MSGPVAQPKNIRKFRVCFLVYLVGHETALGGERAYISSVLGGRAKIWIKYGMFNKSRWGMNLVSVFPDLAVGTPGPTLGMLHYVMLAATQLLP